MVRLEIEILAIQLLLYMPCLISDAALAVEVHSCMDINPKIAVVTKKSFKKSCRLPCIQIYCNIMNLG